MLGFLKYLSPGWVVLKTVFKYNKTDKRSKNFHENVANECQSSPQKLKLQKKLDLIKQKGFSFKYCDP